MKEIAAVTFVALSMFVPSAYAQDAGTGSPAQGREPRMVVAQMMGGGMMGGGMMGQSPREDQAATTPVNPKRADALRGYIRRNNLPCSSCHSVSGPRVGPSFATISANYARQDHAAAILADHIANGFGRMPGELARKSQAAVLANMIQGLTKPE